MIEETKRKYGFASWPNRTRREGAALLTHFRPLRKDFSHWLLSFIEFRELKNRRRSLRIVFDRQTDKDARLLILRYENPDIESAFENLIQVLANNQIGHLERGPDGLGDVSFVHPTGMPPAVFMSRANVCLCITSFGRTEVDVMRVAYLLDSRITERPVISKFGQLHQSRASIRFGMESRVVSSLRVGDEESYFKFFANTGEMFLRGGEVYIRPSGRGDAVIEVFAVEPDGEIHGERIVVEID